MKTKQAPVPYKCKDCKCEVAPVADDLHPFYYYPRCESCSDAKLEADKKSNRFSKGWATWAHEDKRGYSA